MLIIFTAHIECTKKGNSEFRTRTLRNCSRGMGRGVSHVHMTSCPYLEPCRTAHVDKFYVTLAGRTQPLTTPPPLVMNICDPNLSSFPHFFLGFWTPLGTFAPRFGASPRSLRVLKKSQRSPWEEILTRSSLFKPALAKRHWKPNADSDPNRVWATPRHVFAAPPPSVILIPALRS